MFQPRKSATDGHTLMRVFHPHVP